MTPPRLARFRRTTIWYLVSRCGGQVASLILRRECGGVYTLARRCDCRQPWSAARRRDISLRALWAKHRRARLDESPSVTQRDGTPLVARPTHVGQPAFGCAWDRRFDAVG